MLSRTQHTQTVYVPYYSRHKMGIFPQTTLIRFSVHRRIRLFTLRYEQNLCTLFRWVSSFRQLTHDKESRGIKVVKRGIATLNSSYLVRHKYSVSSQKTGILMIQRLLVNFPSSLILTAWVHINFVLHSSCAPEKVGVNQRGVNHKLFLNNKY